MKTMIQANGKPVKFIDGQLKPLRSRAFEIGFRDTMHSIKTFPLGGTEKFKTLSDFKAGMITACEGCGDKGYVEGVIAAFKVGGVL